LLNITESKNELRVLDILRRTPENGSVKP